MLVGRITSFGDTAGDVGNEGRRGANAGDVEAAARLGEGVRGATCLKRILLADALCRQLDSCTYSARRQRAKVLGNSAGSTECKGRENVCRESHDCDCSVMMKGECVRFEESILRGRI